MTRAQARNSLRSLLQLHDVKDISGLVRIDRVKVQAQQDAADGNAADAFMIAHEVCAHVHAHRAHRQLPATTRGRVATGPW
jgi:hypothetical protein